MSLIHGGVLLLFISLFSLVPSGVFSKAVPTPVRQKHIVHPIKEYFNYDPANAGKRIPFYLRGNFEYILSKEELERSVRGWDFSARLRSKLEYARKEQVPLKTTTIGGSITSGQGCSNGHSWPIFLRHYLEDFFPKDLITLSNGAMGGITSNYMNVCHRLHIALDTDIIFVEFSVNDFYEARPLFHNPTRMCFERMLRKLLNYPRHPAVVLVHAFSFFRTDASKTFYQNAENELSVLGDYYGMPQVSLRTAVYHRFMRGDVPGFWTNTTTTTNVSKLSGYTFYFDNIHPDGWVGSRVLAELPIYLIQRAWDSLKSESKLAIAAGTEASRVRDLHRAAARPIPIPMMRNNYESNSDSCLIGGKLQEAVTFDAGFEWINEATTMRPKWGYVARLPGSVLELEVDTQLRPSDDDSRKALDEGAEIVLVQIAHLRSYENMGDAKVSCHGGCKCQPSRLRGLWEERSSQISLHPLRVSAHPKCRIQIEVEGDVDVVSEKMASAGVAVPNLDSVKDLLAERDAKFAADSSAADSSPNARTSAPEADGEGAAPGSPADSRSTRRPGSGAQKKKTSGEKANEAANEGAKKPNVLKKQKEVDVGDETQWAFEVVDEEKEEKEEMEMKEEIEIKKKKEKEKEKEEKEEKEEMEMEEEEMKMEKEQEKEEEEMEIKKKKKKKEKEEEKEEMEIKKKKEMEIKKKKKEKEKEKKEEMEKKEKEEMEMEEKEEMEMKKKEKEEKEEMEMEKKEREEKDIEKEEKEEKEKEKEKEEMETGALQEEGTAIRDEAGVEGGGSSGIEGETTVRRRSLLNRNPNASREDAQRSAAESRKKINSLVGNKVKVTGIIVIDDLQADGKGLQNYRAIEYTSDISFRGNGTFEISNHVR